MPFWYLLGWEVDKQSYQHILHKTEVGGMGTLSMKSYKKCTDPFLDEAM